MDTAQLARNIADGKGYTTLFIRPLSLYLVQKNNEAGQAGAPRPVPYAARLRARISWYEHLRGSAMSPAIVRLNGQLEPEISAPAADRLLGGSPVLAVRNFFTDSSQQFFAGRWSATRGKWRVRYSENELCVMTAGRVIIESESGERQNCAKGLVVQDRGPVERADGDRHYHAQGHRDKHSHEGQRSRHELNRHRNVEQPAVDKSGHQLNGK